MKASRFQIYILCVAGFVFALSLPAFLQELLGTKVSDLPGQFDLVQPLSVYSLLNPLVRLMALMSPNEIVMGWFASVFLSTCVALKGALSFRVLGRRSRSMAVAAFFSVAMVLVMPIANWWNPTSIYLGQFAPTIWHNATAIVVIPVAILHFFASVRSLDTPSLRNSVLTGALGALEAGIKPSYLLAILPVFLPWFCYRAVVLQGMKWRPLVIHCAVLAGPASLVMIVQAILLATLAPAQIILSPFAVWNYYSPHPLASLLLSLGFPVAVAVLYRAAWPENRGLVLGWLAFAVAVAIYILFAEAGERFIHGNFGWGPMIAIFLLFLVSAETFLRQPASIRGVPVFAVFLIHLASGIYFYHRIVSGEGY
jgi:hypothetical protein